jgi:hypothetical protein
MLCIQQEDRDRLSRGNALNLLFYTKAVHLLTQASTVRVVC